jgi:flagellar hook-length control protein FliK
MQLKPPVNPAAAAAPFLAINAQPGGAPEGSAPGGSSAFARLMESQARSSTAPLPVPPPPALSSPAKEPLHPHPASQGGGNEVKSPAPQPNEASSSRGKAEARPTQDNGSKAAAQQQTERNRLNAQREARSTAARAESRPAAPQSGQSAKAAGAKAADSQAASPDDEEGTQQATGDDKLLSPLALLNLIGASAQALPSGSPGCGSLSDETAQALAAQDAAAGLPGDGASALTAAGVNGGAALPAAAGASPDAAGDPLAGTAAAGLLATSAHSPSSAKGLHPGLSPSQGGSSAAVSAGNGATTAAGPAAGIAIDPGLASKTAAQQAEWTAMAASGAISSQNAGRGGAPGGAADALNPGNFAAMLNGQIGPAGNDAASTVSVNLPTPVQSPEFREMLGAQVSLLAQDGVQSAELHLNPADMGPISVQITLDGTQARVDFGADSASTRQLIESGLPELASALRDAGLTLSGGGVSQHAPQQQQGRGDASSSGQGGDGRRAGNDIGPSDATPVRSAAVARRVALGGVDVYA